MTSRTTVRCAARPLGWALVDEDARLDPRSSYAASKVAQEHYTRAWVRQAGARAVALRYHNVYGPGMPRDTPYSGVAAMFRSSLERGEPPQVYEDGGQMRDFVHVADVARANLAALRAVDDGRPAVRRVQRRRPVTRSSILDVATLVSEGTGRDRRSRGDRRLPARRRPARGRLARPGRRAELGFTAEVAPSRGCPAFATAPLRASLITRPCRRGAAPPAPHATWRPSPQRRHRRGSSAHEIVNQGTNGSQIRSTSALLIPDGVGERDHRDGRRARSTAPGRHVGADVAAVATAAASAAAGAGPR